VNLNCSERPNVSNHASPHATRNVLLTTQDLKEAYLSFLSRLSEAGVSLRQVVNDLVDAGATRRELISWAVEAGYNERTMRTLISKLLCKKGRRQRKIGAGRKLNPDVQTIAEAVCAYYGHDRAAKLLRAASRVAVAIAEAAKAGTPEPLPANLRGQSFTNLKKIATPLETEFCPLIVANNKNAIAAVN